MENGSLEDALDPKVRCVCMCVRVRVCVCVGMYCLMLSDIQALNIAVRFLEQCVILYNAVFPCCCTSLHLQRNQLSKWLLILFWVMIASICVLCERVDTKESTGVLNSAGYHSGRCTWPGISPLCVRHSTRAQGC